ncbi:MAG: hypothetical protein AAF560_05235 [Acidobacteriota bacterium]
MTPLATARGLLIVDFKQVTRDRFLSFVLVYSLVLAVAVRFGVPALAAVLLERYGVDLVPYYGLISSFVGLTLGSMVGLVLGFLLLDARETRLVEAISVSPATFEGFLSYRIALPIVLAIALNPLCAVIAGLLLPPAVPLITLSVFGALFGGISTLALATFADNKIQAFAVMKMISGVGMIPLAAYFVDAPLQYLFGLFPPYWLFKAWWLAVDGAPSWGIYAALGAVANAAFLLWMKRRFERLVHRQ